VAVIRPRARSPVGVGARVKPNAPRTRPMVGRPWGVTVMRARPGRLRWTRPTYQYGPSGSMLAGSVTRNPGPRTVTGVELSYCREMSQRPEASGRAWWAAKPA